MMIFNATREMLELQRIIALNERKTELLRELECSLAICKLWPEAFDGGQKVSTKFSGPWAGREFAHRMNGIPNSEASRKTLRFRIVRQDGEEREFNCTDIPDVLYYRQWHRTFDGGKRP